MPKGVSPRKLRDPAVRLWAKVNRNGPTPIEHGITTPCWLWTGARAKRGYGNFGIGGGQTVAAHVYAFEERHGPVPAGKQVNHACHNRLCVRHTYAGTQQQNLREAGNLGRMNTRGKLTPEAAAAIREDSRAYGEIAAAYDVSRATVCYIKRGKVRHLPKR